MKHSLLRETYELVKSLSKTEKRYFTLFTRFQHGDKSYLKLFDILDSQGRFDEEAITEKFARYYEESSLPAVRKYLFDQIIESIKAYGAYKDADSVHSDLIETYKILKFKGLKGQSQRLLQKIKAITLEDEAYIRHVYVLLLEYVAEMFSREEPDESRVKQVLAEKNRTLEIIANYTLVGDPFSLQRLYLRRKLFCRTAQEKEELTGIMQPVLQTSEADMLSPTALGLRSMGLCDYYMAIGEPEKAFSVSRTHVAIRPKSAAPEKIRDAIISENLQHLWLCVRSGQFRDFEERHNNFRQLLDQVKSRQYFLQGYERWYNYAMLYFNRTGQFDRAKAFAAEQEATLQATEMEFSRKARIMLRYAWAYNHYATGDTRNALLSLQKLMNESNEQVEEYIFSKLLLMIIHYELGNMELVAYQLRSYVQLLRKTNRMYDTERVIVDFFRQATQKDGISQTRDHLKIMQQKIHHLFGSSCESGVLFYFDLESWIESRLAGRDFAAVVRERRSG